MNPIGDPLYIVENFFIIRYKHLTTRGGGGGGGGDAGIQAPVHICNLKTLKIESEFTCRVLP